MRFIVLIASLALTAAAFAAEPWEGVWTHIPPQDRNSDACDLINLGMDGGPVEFSPREARNLEAESICAFSSITKIRRSQAWIVDLACSCCGGGDKWNRRVFLMETINPKGLAVFHAGFGRVTQLYRCPSPPRPKPSPAGNLRLQLNCDLPFIGNWAEDLNGCDSPMFRFEADGYAVSGQDFSRFTKLVGGENTIVEGGIGVDYNMIFPDGYSISLLNVTKTSMTWHSVATGDTFDLVRCPSPSSPRPKP